MGEKNRNGRTRRGADASSSQNARRREPLRDNYYYEQPLPGKRYTGNSKPGSGKNFEDISSHSGRGKSNPAKKSGKKEKKKGGKKTFFAFFFIFLLIFCAVWYVFGYLLSGLNFNSVDKDSLGVVSSQNGGVKNIALFGLDSRENDFEGRSDSILVLSMDSKRNKLKLISILRDSRVNIEGYGSDKITHAYAYGGPELAINTINQNFNLNIEAYVTVNFFQMAKIVDAFGGTRVTVSYEESLEIDRNLSMLAAESGDAGIKESDYLYGNYGDMLLNGNQAVAYSRIRSLDGGDSVRASRQQNVLHGLIAQMKSMNVLQYPGLIREVAPLCETSLGAMDMFSLLPFIISDFDTESMSVPGDGDNAYGDYLDNGAWVYTYDLDNASRRIDLFIYEEDSVYYTATE